MSTDLNPTIVTHQIIGTQKGRQGAGQVVPEDLVLCTECGWMRVSDYTWHMSDLVAQVQAEARASGAKEALLAFAGVVDQIARLGAHNTGLRGPAHLAEYTRHYAERIAREQGGGTDDLA